MKIISHPSPNFGERRLDARPDLVVLHYTAMTSAKAAISWLCDPESEVSAHYLVSPAGRVLQMVDEEMRAWHAGAGSWGACTDVNSRSIGIELANDGFSPFATAQMDTLEILLGAVLERWKIPPARVIGHSDMAPGRKRDPGPRFDWQRLARRGLSVWPHIKGEAPDGDAEIGEFLHHATAFGYSAKVAADELLAVFRQRFQPWSIGPLRQRDMASIIDLATRFPVDRPALSA